MKARDTLPRAPYYLLPTSQEHELQETKSLQLEQVSPKLLQAHQLELAVPGTYHASRQVIAIQRFAPFYPSWSMPPLC